MCLFSIGVTRKNRVEILLSTPYLSGGYARGEFEAMGIEGPFFGSIQTAQRPVKLVHLPQTNGRRVAALDISGPLHKMGRVC